MTALDEPAKPDKSGIQVKKGDAATDYWYRRRISPATARSLRLPAPAETPFTLKIPDSHGKHPFWFDACAG